jgi:hypothetical protein
MNPNEYQGNTYPPYQPNWNSEPPAKPKRKNGCGFWLWMLLLGNIIAFPIGWAVDHFLGLENPHSRFLKGESPSFRSNGRSSNDETHSSESNEYGSYVAPHITRSGRFVKGHFRKRVSTSPNALKNRMRSRYYYQTHKYRYKKHRK